MSRAHHHTSSFRAQRGIPLLFVSAFLLLFAAYSSAQVATGTPPFNSFSGGPDIVNNGNLNDHWVFPIRHKPGRGKNFAYDLSYDSSVWYPVSAGSTTSWQPVNQLGWSGLTATGYATHQTTGPHTCRFFQETQWVTESYHLYVNWVYVDSSHTARPMPETGQAVRGHFGPPGTAHPMIGQIQDGGAPDCGPSDTATLTTNDGSGYKLSVPDETLYTPEGLVGSLSGNTTTDRNGNQITQSGGTYTDTLGTTALTVTGSGTAASPYVFTYTAPSGASAHYTLNYTNYTVATNFGISGINEYKSSAAVPLPTSLVLPDGSQYTFTYEPTPSTPSQGACTPWAGTTCTTARLASVTLPTGGTISYLYYNGNNNFSACTTGNNGVFSDGSASCLLRATPDGTWTYVRSLVSGTEWKTLVTDPTSAANQTLIYFQKDSNGTNPTPNFYETQRLVYQGSTSGQLLRQATMCYNGNTTNCTTTAVYSPITQRNVNDQYGSSGLQCQHNYFYNSVGGLTEKDDYDYGSGSYGALLRKTLITYASLPPNITALQQTVTICNGTGSSSSCAGPSGGNTGTVVAQTNYNYDETTPTTTSGITQHTSVSGSRGNLTSIHYPAGSLTAHFTYYDTGVLNTSQDVNSATTTYNYSSANNAYCNWAFATSISEPLSMSKSFVWNCTGGVMTSLTDENSQITSTTYSDPYFWRPASVTFPDTGQTSWTYNATSLTTTTKMNSSQNIVSTVLLDGLGRTSQTQLNDPEGNDYSAVTYDALGRPYKAYNPTRCNPPTTYCGTDPTWGYTTTAYDPLNRPTSVTLQDGSVVSASYTNNTVTTTDPAGKTRQSTFDALGRLTQVVEDPGTSPHLNYITSYTFDALGNLTNVTQNGGRQRTFVFDAMSRLTSETNPETGTITYKYDSDSNCASPNSSSGDLVSRTDTRNVRSCFQYDTLHRLTQKNYSDGTTPTAYFAYDMTSAWGTTLTNPKGRLTELWTGTPSTATTGTIFGYDAMGRITINNQLTPLGTSYPVGYTYDLVGDTTSTNYLNGFTISQTYDAAGRPASVTSSVNDSNHPGTLATVDSSVGYYPPGALRKMTFGNNLTETTAFNNALEPCRINWNSSSTALGSCTDGTPSGNLQDFSYGFNAGSTNNGNVASWSGTGQQAFTRTFGYDSLNRLSSMQETSGSAEGCKPASSPSNPYNLTWTFDAWGNRTNQAPSAGTCSFSQNVNTQNQLSSPYQYDAAGNMTNDGNHTYFYDAENRLIQVDGTLGTCSTATACYVYGASGSRIEKITGSNQVHYFRDLAGNVLVEKDQNSTWLADYIYQAGKLVAEYKSGTTYFVLSDHLGSSRLLTGVNQSVAQNLDYLPFGEILSSDSGNTTHKFTGDERDSETNLDHTWFRQYSSHFGRWMHPDPAGLAAVDPANPQSWNRYSYVRNNPLNRIDHSGMSDCPDDKSTCGDDWSDPESGSPGVDLFGGMNLFPDEGSDRSLWDGSSIRQCLCTDGIIMGNDIFDAVMGAPGTFLTLNSRGQQGFGFSENLWSMTQNFLDANPSLRGSSGLQVLIQNSGVYQVTSGLVPEYVALLQQRSQVLAGMPNRFAQDMAVEQDALVAAGMDPGTAAFQALQYEVNLMQRYFGDEPDAASWLNMWQGLNQAFTAWANRWSSVFPYVP